MPRLFIAIPISKNVQEELAKICEHRSHWPVRWAPAENLHLTLIFLGNRSMDDIKTISNSMKKIARDTNYFRLRLSYYEIIPNKLALEFHRGKRPKLIWIKCRNNTDIEKIFDKLYLSLKAINPDPRSNSGTSLVKHCKYYLPHVTLARFKKTKKMLSSKTGNWKLGFENFVYAPSLPHYETRSFSADRITLFESILGPDRSEYKKIYSVKLKTK